MSYIGSYVWKIRQKIGHDELITATVDAVAIKDGKVCLVFNRDFNAWTLPAGHVELNDSWQSAIKTEMLEEAGLLAEEKDLLPFATISGPGYKYKYPNGDKTSPFSLVFVCEKFVEGELSDTEEIAGKKWVDLSDIDETQLTNNAKVILRAYEKYVATNVFQQIVLRDEA